MRVSLSGRRSTTQKTPRGLEIVIPSKRNVFLLLFLSAWMVGWVVGEVFAARQVILGKMDGGHLFLMAWLAGWTIGGAWVMYSWLWMIAGKEIVVLQPSVLTIKRCIFGFGRTKEYDVIHVRNVRVTAPGANDPFGWGASMRFWGMGGGLVAFDYGAGTFRFGGSLDEAEAHQIVEELKGRYSFADGVA